MVTTQKQMAIGRLETTNMVCEPQASMAEQGILKDPERNEQIWQGFGGDSRG
jgi:heat shock protein HslJ